MNQETQDRLVKALEEIAEELRKTNEKIERTRYV